jgi:hypothetical protein
LFADTGLVGTRDKPVLFQTFQFGIDLKNDSFQKKTNSDVNQLFHFVTGQGLLVPEAYRDVSAFRGHCVTDQLMYYNESDDDLQASMKGAAE